MRNLLILILIPFHVFALKWSSKETKTHLIELFTSESCSSCPPAERWLNQIKTKAELWSTIVPVEFHVDYWNHLSWKDPFSNKLFTERQRKYARQMKSDTVFTPQLLLNGNTNLKSSHSYPEKSSDKVGSLFVNYDKRKKLAKIVFTSKEKKKSLYCEGALLGGGFKNKIPSGENEGKVLEHEFIALSFQSVKMESKGEKYQCQLQFDKSHLDSKRKAIAIWVKNNNGVIQATGREIK